MDDPELGGIGHVAMKDCHFFRKFGIAMERTEPPSGPKIDKCYAADGTPYTIDNYVGMLLSMGDDSANESSSSGEPGVSARTSQPPGGRGATRSPWGVMDQGEAEDPVQIPSSCLLYTSPSPRDQRGSRMPSSA